MVSSAITSTAAAAAAPAAASDVQPNSPALADERFGDFCHRIGVDRVRAELGTERWVRTKKAPRVLRGRTRHGRAGRRSGVITISGSAAAH
jgi:hypothetical protein